MSRSEKGLRPTEVGLRRSRESTKVDICTVTKNKTDPGMRPPDMVGVGTYFVVGRDTGGGRRWYRLIGPLPEAELPSRVLDRSYDTSYIGLGRGSFNSLRRVLRFPRCLLSG